MTAGKSSVISVFVCLVISISLVIAARDSVTLKDREYTPHGTRDITDDRHVHQERYGAKVENNVPYSDKQDPNPLPNEDPKLQSKLKKHMKHRETKVAKFKTERNKAKTSKDWFKTIQKEAKYLVKWEIKKHELEHPSNKEKKGDTDAEATLETIMGSRELQRIEKDKAFQAVLLYTSHDEELNEAIKFEKEIYFAIWDIRTKQIQVNFQKGIRWKPTFSSTQSYSDSSSSSSESSSSESQNRKRKRGREL